MDGYQGVRGTGVRFTLRYVPRFAGLWLLVCVVTLRDPPVPRVATFLAHNSLFRAGPISISHFTLFSSFLQSSGPIYTAEADAVVPPARGEERPVTAVVLDDEQPHHEAGRERREKQRRPPTDRQALEHRPPGEGD